jgi:hypothetical protein
LAQQDLPSQTSLVSAFGTVNLQQKFFLEKQSVACNEDLQSIWQTKEGETTKMNLVGISIFHRFWSAWIIKQPPQPES